MLHPGQCHPPGRAIWAVPADTCHLQVAASHSAPAPETCPRNSLAVQPQSRPRTGAVERLQDHTPGHLPHGCWQEQEFGGLSELAMVDLSSVRTVADPYALCILLYTPTRAVDGHFISMSWKDLSFEVLAGEAGIDLSSAWAAKNLEMTDSYHRHVGILWELRVVSAECCALRTATVPQHHWAWFLKEKSCPREPGC